MTDLDPGVVRDSWARIARYGDTIPLWFYELLFHVHPEYRAIFPTSMRRQRHHLFVAVDTVVGAADMLDDEAVLEVIEHLGRMHARFAGADEFAAVGRALLVTLQRFDPQWTETTGEHWALLYGIVQGVMLDAGAKVRSSIDPSPQWYTVRAVHRPMWRHVTLELDAFDAPIDTTPLVWLAARPGAWTPAEPATPDRVEFTVTLPVNDLPRRALAATRPGTRIAAAPLLEDPT